jgi:predicted Zn-dependent protease
MKRLRALACLGVLILGVTLIIGCGNGGAETPTTKHFTENGISFDYPKTWGSGNSSNPNAIAALVSPTTEVFVVVLKETLPSGYTLKRYNDETVNSLNPTQQTISETSPTVAGVPACDSVFKTDDSQMRIVILEKNDNVYVIICSAPVAAFDNAQTSFNTVINSFQVQ